ncbi:SDR family oxidoreductase [Xanthomonas euroxanthea]|uniref:SDR family oxidoreductase n=1 Tax=Xanthomonas euroxanthea TaxID=2259622 RepID=A0A8E4G602_9XANT|nr:SDR family oxidoreductase [Xanthomonas euroxanthea]CAD1791593.1 SDR family oxidoreductase [Xanthomonas euroxanthea]SYZ56444.1 KR domain-containing protein [Xanthomonas arboricola pv. juglandis]
MDLQLKGKTAVVTGASQGLGRAIALELAREGVKVFGTARNEELLASLVCDAAAQGLAPIDTFIQDFMAADAPKKIADQALGVLGYVDILINNAGGSRPIDMVGEDSVWEETMTLNFDRHRQLTQHLIPQFVEREQGSILNITGTYEAPVVNAGSVAKAAMAVWSKGLSSQLGKHGVTVNSLQPGLLDTAQIRRLFPGDARREYAQAHISLGDFGEPQDVANVATFLVSTRARYMTGSVTTVDGGMRYYSF